MYDNIGNKIKKLATVIFVILALASFILALIIGTGAPFIGLVLMFAGPVLAWISSFVLYGFGELVDKACAIERNTICKNWEPETPTKSNLTKIAEIEKLHSKGLISDDEYQQTISKIQ